MAKLQNLSTIALLFIVVFLLYDVKEDQLKWEYEAVESSKRVDSLQKVGYLQDLTIGYYGRTYDIFIESHPDLKHEMDSIMSVVK
jgi:hypothetical protein